MLHNDCGPAADYSEFFRLWSIEGVEVDEQIVMSPESQTLEQIDGEQNNDVKSIRIERFGWDRYLKESGAEVVDSRRNEVENTHEALCRTKSGQLRFMATCPSGKKVSLGLPPNGVETCEQAQNWLSGSFSGRRCVGRT